MNELRGHLMAYGRQLVSQATGVSPDVRADTGWVMSFVRLMGDERPAALAQPAQTVFSRIQLGKSEPATTFWPPVPLSASPGNPMDGIAGVAIEARHQLGAAFFNVADSLSTEPRDFTRFYHLMAIYAAALPATYDEPGVSLFQQWKTVAALAWLAQSAQAPPEQVLLVSGDLPGIQRAIYTISSKGAAKTLRGRSFFVQLLGDAAVRRLLYELELCEPNVVYDAGGNFLLLARSRQAAQVKAIAVAINQVLLDAFDGTLQLALATLPIATSLIMDPAAFGAARKELSRLLAEAKQRPFMQVGPDFAKLWQPYGTGGDQYCHVTGVDLPDQGVPLGGIEPGENPIPVSPLVYSLADLAYRIRHPRLQMLLTPDVSATGQPAHYGDRWSDILIKISGWRYTFSEMPLYARSPQIPTDALAYAINEPGAVAAGYHGFRFVANVTPHVTEEDRAWWMQENLAEEPPARGDIRGFAMLAHAAAGAGAIERVGVLRMDVDNLGKIFADSYLSMPLLAELSARLDHFFSGRLNAVVREEAGNDAYVIYAGGDDLFIVGAWHRLPSLAAAIREAFRAYIGQHPDFTISGGLTLEQPAFPIYRAATRAAEAEEQAKRHVRFRRYENGRVMLDASGEPQLARRKDALSFLGTVVPWEEWAELFRHKEALLALAHEGPAGENPVPRAFIHVVRKVHADYDDSLRLARQKHRADPRSPWPDERHHYGRHSWMQAYALGRMAERHPARRGEIIAIQGALLLPHKIRLAGLAARWAEYLLRREDAS